MNRQFALALVVAVVLGLGSGAGVAALQQGAVPSAGRAANGLVPATGTPGVSGQPATTAVVGQGSRPVVGTVEKVEGSTLTVQGQSGAVRVALSDRTIVSRQERGEVKDVAVGASIVATGQSEGDPLNAASVQVLGPEGEAAPTVMTFGQGQGQAGAAGGLRRAARVSGKVQAVDGNTVTVATEAGTARVALSDTTVIQKNVRGAVADLKQGTNVAIQGDAGADGVVQARSVQIMPNLPGRGG